MAEEQGVTNLPIKREMFCQYFVRNAPIRGNATQCYAKAYHYKLEDLPDDDGVYDEVTDEEGNVIAKKEITPSTRKKAERVCSVEGARLLTFPRIQDRIRELLNEMLRDDVVDAELTKVILQDRDLTAKNKAITTYNDIKGRIIKKSDITSKGQRINTIDDEAIDKLIAAHNARAKRTASTSPRK